MVYAGIEHVAEIVFDALAHERVCAQRIQFVFVHQPAKQLGGGVLDSLIQRAGVARGVDVLIILGARPVDGLPFAQIDVNWTSHEISTPVPTISPSPWTA
jgi:hypothetical protein